MADATIKIRGGAGNAVQIQSRNIDATAPSDGQALAWSSSDSEWEPTTVGGGGSSEWTDTGSVLHPSEETVDNVVVGGTTTANSDIVLGVDGAAVFNEQGADADFRVESDGNANMFFVDGGEDGIGLGTSDVKSVLTVGTAAPVITVDTDDANDNKSLTLCGGGAGSITRGPYVFLGGNEHATGANKGTIKLACGVGDGSSNVGDLYVYQGTGANNRLLIDQGETVFNEDSIDADFRVESNGSANMLFVDGGNNRVGVNSGSPTEALDVDGAVALKEQSSAPSATADYAKIYTEEYGNDSSVKLLLHCDGSNDGTTFTDSSASSHSVTRSGAVTKTGVKVFGSASGFFDGSNDDLVLPSSADWAFGTGDFTIEFWINPSSYTNYGAICHTYKGDTDGFVLSFFSTGGNLAWYDGAAGGDTWTDFGSDSKPPLSTWSHVAYSKNSGTLNVFLNGRNVGSIADNGDYPTTVLEIGSQFTSYGYFHGYLDEFRICKGVADYTSDFTPQRSAYPVSNIVIVDDNGGTYKLGRNW